MCLDRTDIGPVCCGQLGPTVISGLELTLNITAAAPVAYAKAVCSKSVVWPSLITPSFTSISKRYEIQQIMDRVWMASRVMSSPLSVEMLVIGILMSNKNTENTITMMEFINKFQNNFINIYGTLKMYDT